MTAELNHSHAVDAPPRGGRAFLRFPWALVLLCVVIVGLFADRVYYLRNFGAVYTEADQTMLWYQADDLAHGIFREPCYYGQAYNVPVEAWVAVPLLWAGVRHAVALPVATIVLALVPFFVMAGIAWRRGQRWGAAIILLIPLALPVEYVVVTSIPRGFVGGIAIGSVAVGLWLAGRSRMAFLLAGFLAVVAVAVNPNSVVLLLAGGLYALINHFRERRFYLYSAVGGILGSPAPLYIHYFYKWHPASAVYQSQPPVTFHWSMLRETLVVGGHLNARALDLFFADFFPVAHRGWWMLVVFVVMIVVPLVQRRWKVALVLGATVLFVIGTLGIVRVHTALPQVFYSGSRMYLALPVVFGLFVLWCGGWVRRNVSSSAGVAAAEHAQGPFPEHGTLVGILGAVLLCGLVVCASLRNLSAYKPPSPLIERTWPLAIDRVQDLEADAHGTAEICRKYGVTLVIPCDGFLSSFKESGPAASGHAFETLYPPFERRVFRIEAERKNLHSAVLLYRPSLVSRIYAMSVYPRTRVVSQSPYLVLVEVDKPTSGLEIAEKLGFGYNAHL